MADTLRELGVCPVAQGPYGLIPTIGVTTRADPDLHQLVSAQGGIELGQDGRSHTLLTDHDDGFEAVCKSSEMAPLCGVQCHDYPLRTGREVYTLNTNPGNRAFADDTQQEQ